MEVCEGAEVCDGMELFKGLSVSHCQWKQGKGRRDQAYDRELMLLMSVSVRALIDHAGVARLYWRVADNAGMLLTMLVVLM